MNIHPFGVTLIAGGEAAVIIKTSTGGIYSPAARKDFSAPKIKDNEVSIPWAKWGENNDLPNNELAKYIGNVGVLSAGNEMISRIAMGRGPVPVIVKGTDEKGNEDIEVVDDDDIHSFLEDNNVTTFAYETILDACNTGHVFSQFIANKNRDKINRLRRTDASIGRFEKRDPRTGKISNLYLSYEWGEGAKPSDDYIRKLPLLDKDNPYMSLLDEDGDQQVLPAEFAVASHYPLFNRQYYALPQYWPARKWCDIAMGVPEMKAAMFNNQMTIKYIIEIDEVYWTKKYKRWAQFTDDQRDEAYRKRVLEIEEFLAGNKNAYKSLLTGTRIDPTSGQSIPYTRVTAIDDKIKDGKLLPDSAAANSEILFTLMLNPALIGVDMPGGMYGGGKGGSNIRESYLVQILIREIERQFVVKPLNLIAKVNGWKDRHPRLQIRFPNHYLTTLDSGKNAEPIV